MLNKQPHAVKLQRFVVFIAFLFVSAAGCHTYKEGYEGAKVRTQEDALQRALTYTRQAIRDYTNDHGKPPNRLEDLVASGYFDAIPIEPCKEAGPCEKLIKDVHSSLREKSSKGTLYSEW
jgi:hypothetical protein